MSTTEHYDRVKLMMEGFGQHSPNQPTIPSPELIMARARLTLEEVIEKIRGMGISIKDNSGHPIEGVIDLFLEITGPFDMQEVADGCADISVVNTGDMIAFGIKDVPLLEEVDSNNLLKINNGHLNEHGKFVKASNHPKPDVVGVLKKMGWEL